MFFFQEVSVYLQGFQTRKKSSHKNRWISWPLHLPYNSWPKISASSPELKFLEEAKMKDRLSRRNAWKFWEYCQGQSLTSEHTHTRYSLLKYRLAECANYSCHHTCSKALGSRFIRYYCAGVRVMRLHLGNLQIFLSSPDQTWTGLQYPAYTSVAKPCMIPGYHLCLFSR